MAERFSFVNDWLLRAVRRVAGNPGVRIDLQGRNLPAPAILYRDRAALVRSILGGECGFGDGYANGHVRVDGDLVTVLEEVYRSLRAAHSPTWLERSLKRVRLLAHPNSRAGARRNIHRHYDIGTGFYRLWLDRDLVYTCAYFDDPEMTLEEAQQAKMDLVCRKLGLRSGERVVEAGCGWGSLALHMARNYGVVVRAYNISADQICWARQRAREEEITGRVEFVEDDYRSITGKYDVFVSIGMLEHVGASNYAELGRVIHRAVGASGRGLLHFIGRDRPEPLSPWINQRIFPGAYAPTLAEMLPLLEPWEYSVLDVENLRPHYARTLQHWLKRYERAYSKVVAQFGEEFARAWHLYLAGSVAAFRAKTLQLFQVLFAGRECAFMPWTRKALYAWPTEAPCAAATF
ncbi:MAG TPA: cyclopropane-fatty-acyl-phospholipid synthase family protein [Bryobacteraceae bacterium]|nr:cyclopropane-fatty-acyl-phospholipid synthase family protein [Bryobacteraceae bacterium]